MTSVDVAGHPRVLVVDDDSAILRVIRLSLELEGIESEPASSGIEALAKLDREHFDAIVLDLSMPVMDGRETYRRLRARGDMTPVLILTAFGEDRIEGAMRAERFVRKPFDPEELAIAVLETAGAMRASAQAPEEVHGA